MATEASCSCFILLAGIHPDSTTTLNPSCTTKRFCVAAPSVVAPTTVEQTDAHQELHSSKSSGQLQRLWPCVQQPAAAVKETLELVFTFPWIQRLTAGDHSATTAISPAL